MIQGSELHSSEFCPVLIENAFVGYKVPPTTPAITFPMANGHNSLVRSSRTMQAIVIKLEVPSWYIIKYTLGEQTSGQCGLISEQEVISCSRERSAVCH